MKKEPPRTKPETWQTGIETPVLVIFFLEACAIYGLIVYALVIQ